MKVEIEIDEEDDPSEVLNEIAGQIRNELDDEGVVAIQAGTRGVSYQGIASGDDTSFREIIGTIEFVKSKMIQHHGRQ